MKKSHPPAAGLVKTVNIKCRSLGHVKNRSHEKTGCSPAVLTQRGYWWGSRRHTVLRVSTFSQPQWQKAFRAVVINVRTCLATNTNWDNLMGVNPRMSPAPQTCLLHKLQRMDFLCIGINNRQCCCFKAMF